MAERSFDISWISGKTSAKRSAPDEGPWKDGYPTGEYGYSRERGWGGGSTPRRGEDFSYFAADPFDREVLEAFRKSPEERLHVVDLAARVRIEFNDALKAVLRLAARGEVSILERDPVANDHVVQLTPAGLEALKKR